NISFSILPLCSKVSFVFNWNFHFLFRESAKIQEESDRTIPKTMTIIDPWTKEPIKLPMTNTEISE
ncbi:unnamed protein product, partial [Hymenolepis diminuta]